MIPRSLQKSDQIVSHKSDSHKSAFKFCSAFIAALVFYCSVIVITFFLPPHCQKLGYFAALKDKHHILSSTSSPKIIFIGGSNLAFGIDSAYLENFFHRSVVNMGLCSSFGLPYLFEEIKDDIKSGDIIILVPEYGLINGQTTTGNPDLIRAFEVYPYSIVYMLRAYGHSFNKIVSLLKIFEGYFHAKWHALFDMVKNACEKKQLSLIFAESREVTAQIGKHARYCFDKHGDYFGHFQNPNAGYIPTKWLIGGMNQDAVNIINYYYKIFKKKNAALVIIPPPVPTEYFILSELTPLQMNNWTNGLVKAPVLADPTRYLIPVSLFFEAPYHLNVEGRALRTNLVIKDLNRYLNKR